jgi:hypothetical protein
MSPGAGRRRVAQSGCALETYCEHGLCLGIQPPPLTRTRISTRTVIDRTGARGGTFTPVVLAIPPDKSSSSIYLALLNAEEEQFPFFRAGFLLRCLLIYSMMPS